MFDSREWVVIDPEPEGCEVCFECRRAPQLEYNGVSYTLVCPQCGTSVNPADWIIKVVASWNQKQSNARCATV